MPQGIGTPVAHRRQLREDRLFCHHLLEALYGLCRCHLRAEAYRAALPLWLAHAGGDIDVRVGGQHALRVQLAEHAAHLTCRDVLPAGKGQQLPKVAIDGGGAAGIAPTEVQMQHYAGFWPLVGCQPLLDRRHVVLVEGDERLRALRLVEDLAQQAHARHGMVQQVYPQIHHHHRHMGLLHQLQEGGVTGGAFSQTRQNHQIGVERQHLLGADVIDAAATQLRNGRQLWKCLPVLRPGLRVILRQIRWPAYDMCCRITRLQQGQRVEHPALTEDNALGVVWDGDLSAEQISHLFGVAAEAYHQQQKSGKTHGSIRDDSRGRKR